jgi:hypothetical protein
MEQAYVATGHFDIGQALDLRKKKRSIKRLRDFRGF